MQGLHKTGSPPTTKRAVLYARVSSDDRGRDGRNLGGQLEMCRTYAQEHGWRVVMELAEDDRGASGASFELPQLNRILEMAQQEEFDVLVVREIDRLSRNLAKQLIVEEELRRAGVQIEYALAEYPDTPEGRLNKHIRATIAEYEREKINERMIRGRRQKVKSGSIVCYGRPAYGYRVGEADGKSTLVIEEPEAQIVRLIFEWYVVGNGDGRPISVDSITARLTEMRVPTSGDIHGHPKKRGYGKWGRTTVTGMLKNETYAGVWHYGTDPATRLSVEVPAIVSHETWEAAQARMKSNRKWAKRNTKNEYLVGRRVYCGECGLKLTSWGSAKTHLLYYRCPGSCDRNNVARECNTPNFRADHVDPVVWEWVKSFLLDPESLAAGLKEVHQEQEKEHAPLRDRLTVVDDLIADNTTQLERLLDLYLSGDFPKETLTDRKSRLERTILALESERSGLETQLEAQLLTEKQIQSIQEFAAKVGEGLEAIGDDFDTKRRIIEELDVWATLSVEDGQKVVYVRCMLGDEELSIETSHTRRAAQRGARRPRQLAQPCPADYLRFGGCSPATGSPQRQTRPRRSGVRKRPRYSWSTGARRGARARCRTRGRRHR
jgi:site-specific DNA recombinase